jgi:hypothetical protein
MKYSILYRKKQPKKHKTWEFDGFLLVDKIWRITDSLGTEVCRGNCIENQINFNKIYQLFNYEFTVENSQENDETAIQIITSERGQSATRSAVIQTKVECNKRHGPALKMSDTRNEFNQRKDYKKICLESKRPFVLSEKYTVDPFIASKYIHNKSIFVTTRGMV